MIKRATDKATVVENSLKKAPKQNNAENQFMSQKFLFLF
jgi:hypothetical protein